MENNKSDFKTWLINKIGYSNYIADFPNHYSEIEVIKFCNEYLNFYNENLVKQLTHKELAIKELIITSNQNFNRVEENEKMIESLKSQLEGKSSQIEDLCETIWHLRNQH